jgi:flagellar assembly protein FliH
MSSKILSPDKAGAAAPIGWGRVPRAASPFVTPDARPSDSVRRKEYEGSWEARIQQLEIEARGRAEAEYRRGLAEGEAAGTRKAAAQIDPVVERLVRTIADLASYRDRFRRESERDLVSVSLAIARRVLRRELTIDPDAILGLVKVAIEKVSLREVHRVRLHPADVAAVRAHLANIQAPQAIEVEGDAGLERGAVIFETSRGSLDASMDTQLRTIEQGLQRIAARKP